MGFVEMFQYDADEPDGLDEPARPPWFAPPDDQVGAAVPLGVVLARSERGAIALSHAIAYPTGVVLEFLAQARALTGAQARAMFHEQHALEHETLPDSVLRLGIELPGGARVSNLGSHRMMRAAFGGDPPAQPVLMPHAGGGGMAGGSTVVMHPGYWLWPLPDAGVMRVSCEWPVVGIALTTVELDATQIVAAAATATPLWS